MNRAGDIQQMKNRRLNNFPEDSPLGKLPTNVPPLRKPPGGLEVIETPGDGECWD